MYPVSKHSCNIRYSSTRLWLSSSVALGRASFQSGYFDSAFGGFTGDADLVPYFASTGAPSGVKIAVWLSDKFTVALLLAMH